jgi:GT2 family glycosyltransferase
MLAIIVPTHNRINRISHLLEELENQIGSKKFDVILINSGNKESSIVLEKTSSSRFGFFHYGVHENNFWAKSISTGINLALKLDKYSNIMLLNDDVFVEKNFISLVYDDLTGLDSYSVLFYPVFEVGSGLTLTNTLSVNSLEMSISNELNLVNSFFKVSDLAPGRCVIYPTIFFKSGGRVRYKLLPHHYADLDLSRQARALGFKLLCSQKVAIRSHNDFSSGTVQKNCFRKLFTKKSPSRLISWFFFWIGYFRTINHLTFRSIFKSFVLTIKMRFIK